MATPILGLTELVSSQAIPEAVVNENVRWLEFFASGAKITDRDDTAPPGSPVDGEAYLVKATATGAWTGQDGKIALYISTAWDFMTPTEGMMLYVADEDIRIQYNGTVWATFGGGSVALDDLTDVTITAPSNGQVLKYNGSAWVNGTDATGGGGGLVVGDITGATDAAPVSGAETLPVAQGGALAEMRLSKAFELLALGDVDCFIPINNATTLTGGFGSGFTSTNVSARNKTGASWFASFRRIGVTLATANGMANVRASDDLFLRSSSADFGGFYYSAMGGMEATQTDCRALWGLVATWAGNNDPSNATNCFFVGFDSGDTNLQVMHNDNSGTCTKVDLGANFPAKTNAADLYRVTLECEPGASTMSYRVDRYQSSGLTHSATGTVSTDLPTSTTVMRQGWYVGTGATAATVTGVLHGMLCHSKTLANM